ncbi:MAG: tRNA adenosine(34) deaminase TadA [Firmicutes bacterium]|jgi:tRNA(adenine34) deaminase|nr:tRNA adenosine(34) deaminase TadA [Bacillota bacterium]MDH7496727.1 tRNA adenosine(34) deaminase TadA [Bacillota bacterium]
MDDELFMRRALLEAKKAYLKGEVPVGAIIVADGQIVARAHNRKEELQDPTAHAEMLAIREAASRLKSWRLLGATMYVTLEPCAMCAGALVLARVERLVYGTPDPKAGAAGSVTDLVRHEALNHRLEVTSGVLQEECSALLQQFFTDLRSS